MEKVNSVSLKKRRVSTINMVKVALLAGIAYALMFLEMPIPLFPGFLKLDLSDMPAIVAGLALGPVAGFAVEAVKNFLHLITATSTGGVGEIANIVVGSSFVVVASFVYKKDFGKGACLWNNSNGYYRYIYELLCDATFLWSVHGTRCYNRHGYSYQSKRKGPIIIRSLVYSTI